MREAAVLLPRALITHATIVEPLPAPWQHGGYSLFRQNPIHVGIVTRSSAIADKLLVAVL